MVTTLLEIPSLGIGELVTITDDPAHEPEKGEVIWHEDEINVMTTQLEGAPDNIRDMWVQYMDAVKRMYVGAKLISLKPLRVAHPELTPEKLETIPWKDLPRR
jgi:hypothetical protein